jgi:putative ABC transport system permease protein
MALAAMGIYGAVAFVVRQQTREIGIRMAIGATASRIVRHVTRQTVRWIIAGLALGFGAALLVSRAIAGLIFGVSGADPLTFLVVTFILGSVAYAASWVPARRASRIDPIVALREE